MDGNDGYAFSHWTNEVYEMLFPDANDGLHEERHEKQLAQYGRSPLKSSIVWLP